MKKIIKILTVVAVIILIFLGYYSVRIYVAWQNYFDCPYDGVIVSTTEVAAICVIISVLGEATSNLIELQKYPLFNPIELQKYPLFNPINWNMQALIRLKKVLLFFFIIIALAIEVFGLVCFFDGDVPMALKIHSKVASELKGINSDDRGEAENAMKFIHSNEYCSQALHFRVPSEDYYAVVERWAEEGSDVAEFLMGERYNRTFGRKIDSAFYWWSRAADHGNVGASVRMAQCYEGSIEVPSLSTNIELAFAWWRKAAEGGSARGYYEMGRIMAEYNQIEEAIYYWKKAADMGNVEAKKVLQKVYSMGIDIE